MRVDERHPAARLRARLAAAVAATALLVACSAGGAAKPTPTPAAAASPAATAAATPTAPPRQRLVLTYFFYWYDAYSGQHLRPQDGLREHLPSAPAPSYKNLAWLQQQLADMAYAGIDVVLPDYWGHGPDEPWSADGLASLALARQQMQDSGQPAPHIGMFYDTTIVGGRDLTAADGKAYFYDNIHDFFTRVPRGQWALIDGRPIVFLFTADRTAAFDQSLFDTVYSDFARDFGVRPYIVREASWDYPILRRQDGVAVRDLAHPIVTDDSYLWGAALNGYTDRGGVAAIGPGYDDTLVPGRHGVVQPRDGGWWYRTNFERALASGKSLLAIETWNEIHEGTAVAETQEYGRRYLDLTREFTAAFHAGAAPSVHGSTQGGAVPAGWPGVPRPGRLPR